MLTIKQIETAAVTAAKEFPIKSISLFGSYANGKNTPQSDVDLLVEFTKPITLITLCSLKLRMEELLGTSVDVIHAPVSEESIIKIDKVVPLYAA
ncbi:MAG: nucleotidyltransferase family protein [Candidatus Ornithomonoglobus sp.]